MKFGFRIRNHSHLPVVFRYRGTSERILPQGVTEAWFPGELDISAAMEELYQVMVHMAASLCAASGRFESDTAPSEFGYEIFVCGQRALGVELLDPAPYSPFPSRAPDVRVNRARGQP
jgi:hypothetical protein